MSACSLTSHGFRQKVGQVPVVKGKMSRAVADTPAAKAIETWPTACWELQNTSQTPQPLRLLRHSIPQWRY